MAGMESPARFFFFFFLRRASDGVHLGKRFGLSLIERPPLWSESPTYRLLWLIRSVVPYGSGQTTGTLGAFIRLSAVASQQSTQCDRCTKPRELVCWKNGVLIHSSYVLL
ncbi:hypothetical protein BGZ63DRAFT_393769 [Mariannaea sp. PMI_226]|nr:hypothetical protein BGZ63DRAFT_393769 [Mariannaea sp. PMI_226]